MPGAESAIHHCRVDAARVVWSRVYVTVSGVSPSVCPSVSPIGRQQQGQLAGLLLGALQAGDIDRQLPARHGSGSHFVTQRPSDPGIQRSGDPVDPVTLFYNELQMSTYV